MQYRLTIYSSHISNSVNVIFISDVTICHHWNIHTLLYLNLYKEKLNQKFGPFIEELTILIASKLQGSARCLVVLP